MKQTTPSQDRRLERLTQNPTCSHCGKTKTLADFPPVCVDYWCRDCRKEYARNLYHKRRAKLAPDKLKALRDEVNTRQNKRRWDYMASLTLEKLAEFRAKINAGNLERRNAVRDTVFNHYGGYVCACCGETERAFLSLDHINNDGSKHRREERIHTGEQMHRWIIRNNFPSTFQVLCMNCNWGKRNNSGVCPHQADKV